MLVTLPVLLDTVTVTLFTKHKCLQLVGGNLMTALAWTLEQGPADLFQYLFLPFVTAVAGNISRSFTFLLKVQVAGYS